MLGSFDVFCIINTCVTSFSRFTCAFRINKKLTNVRIAFQQGEYFVLISQYGTWLQGISEE